MEGRAKPFGERRNRYGGERERARDQEARALVTVSGGRFSAIVLRGRKRPKFTRPGMRSVSRDRGVMRVRVCEGADVSQGRARGAGAKREFRGVPRKPKFGSWAERESVRARPRRKRRAEDLKRGRRGRFVLGARKVNVLREAAQGLARGCGCEREFRGGPRAGVERGPRRSVRLVRGARARAQDSGRGHRSRFVRGVRVSVRARRTELSQG